MSKCIQLALQFLINNEQFWILKFKAIANIYNWPKCPCRCVDQRDSDGQTCGVDRDTMSSSKRKRQMWTGWRLPRCILIDICSTINQSSSSFCSKRAALAPPAGRKLYFSILFRGQRWKTTSSFLQWGMLALTRHGGCSDGSIQTGGRASWVFRGAGAAGRMKKTKTLLLGQLWRCHGYER